MRSDREDAPVGRRLRSDGEGGAPVGRRLRSDGEGGAPVGRRVVLGVLALGGLSLAFGRKLSDGEQAALAVVGPRDPTGLTQLIPAGAGFRFYSVTASIPRRAPADVRIAVGGLVSRPRTWSMAELARLPQSTLVRDFQCVTGWRVPGVTWSGVALPDLLAAAEPRPEATAVRFISYDGAYSESLTLDQARRRDVLVATGLEGKPVSAAHGGPVRMAVLPMYGYKSLKWLDRIELTREVEPGFWEHRGYDVDGWVGRSNGRSDAPT